MKRTMWVVGTLVMALAIGAEFTNAANVKIWPQDLRNARQQYPGSDTVLQIPDGTMVMNDPSTLYYYAWAPIVLPVGSTITKVTCYYRSNDYTGEVLCYLYRRAWGASAEELYHVTVGGEATEYAPHDLTWWGGDQVFHAGYVHYLLVLVKKPASFGGLKIVYAAP